MNFKLRILALLLLVMMVFTSCSLESFMQYIPGLGETTTTTEATTTTTTTKKSTTKKSTTTKKPTPEVPEFDVTQNSLSKDELLALFTLTQEYVDETAALIDQLLEEAMTAENLEQFNIIYEEFDANFYHISEQITIAMIIYYHNMSDEVASARYLDSMDMAYDLDDKYNQTLKAMLDSPLADQIFEGWSEEELEELRGYDPAVVELRKEIDELQVEYDQLLQSDPNYNNRCVEIYKKLVVKNNQLARMYNYENYYDYAAENVYERDYEREELANFRQYLIQYVVPNVQKILDDANAHHKWTSNTKKGRLDEFLNEPFYTNSKRNYVSMYLNSLEGSMGESMRDVFENKNCTFSFASNSHPTAFQTYLRESETPFCFFGSDGQSANTVVHEIGHYYAGLKNNELDNYDLCETHSQGNEFLFLTYCQQYLDADIYKSARANNLRSMCYILIMATVIDEFEQRVYLLDDNQVSMMTGADFDAIMTEVCEPYGGASWVKTVCSDPYSYWRLVCISNPVYYISYAVSATAAVNILAIAEEDYDAALVAYQTLVEGVTYEDGFLGALAKAGLTTPFDEETFQNIETVFKK